MRSFEIIVAVDEASGIGKLGKLPWDLSADMAHFKKMTLATRDPSKINAVIMGRRTWESIPQKFRPLSKRLNIVLTRQSGVALPSDVLCFQSFEDALKSLDQDGRAQKIERVFVIGGASLYRFALPFKECQNIYLTKIYQNFHCDVFFPDFQKDFVEVQATPRYAHQNFKYQFFIFQQKDCPERKVCARA